uniref:Uncharacterized protein n=1 Tax=Ixodes ricinus TaxID=34613 RepID=A0A6B0TSY2_IXORI
MQTLCTLCLDFFKHTSLGTLILETHVVVRKTIFELQSKNTLFGQGPPNHEVPEKTSPPRQVPISKSFCSRSAH